MWIYYSILHTKSMQTIQFTRFIMAKNRNFDRNSLRRATSVHRGCILILAGQPRLSEVQFSLIAPLLGKSIRLRYARQTGIYQHQSFKISSVISRTVLLLVSIFTVSSTRYILILPTLLSMMSEVRIPQAISGDNRFLRFTSSVIKDIFMTLQVLASNSLIIRLMMDCSCITQQKIML